MSLPLVVQRREDGAAGVGDAEKYDEGDEEGALIFHLGPFAQVGGGERPRGPGKCRDVREEEQIATDREGQSEMKRIGDPKPEDADPQGQVELGVMMPVMGKQRVHSVS